MSESTMTTLYLEEKTILRRKIHPTSCCMETMIMEVSCTIVPVDLAQMVGKPSPQL